MAMATTAFSLALHRSISAGARSGRRSRNSRRVTPSPTTTPVPRTLSSRDGSGATTFTRLPLLDSDDASEFEIALSDFDPTPNPDKAQPSNSRRRGSNFQRNRSSRFKPGVEESEDSVDFGDDEEGGEIHLVGEEVKGDMLDMALLSEEEEDDDWEDEGWEESTDLNNNGIWDGEDWEDEDSEESNNAKEKGVPAVMRCFDRAKVFIRSGDGGNGVVAFRREKYVPYGGPSGGNGGPGGDVYFEVDSAMNSLLPFRKAIHFRAGRGSHGQGSNQDGSKGEDVVVRVPPGTVIREASLGGPPVGEVLLELMRPGQRALVLPGGRGGRGNAAFKTGFNKAPKVAENGEKGAEMWLDLEMKLVADVGIVGAPNAGKSTLLSAISAAQPAIASYPFTTLLPNLGVVSLDYDATMVVADLPGLLEGAHRGYGLGHEFLRHSERCSILVHVVDGSSQQPEYEFDAVRLELELFSPFLAEKPYILVYNKMDLPEAYERWEDFSRNMKSRGIDPFCISAMHKQGTHDVILATYKLLQKEMKNRVAEDCEDEENINHVAEAIHRERTSSMKEFEIVHDSDSNTWHVFGAGIERFVQMTNWKYADSLRRFQHALDASGVNKALIKQGIKEGDTVIVSEMELVWENEPNKKGSSTIGKDVDGLMRWPEFT